MPSRCLNRVTLIGNLTRDPELRYTPGGMAVVSFGIATNRVWVTKQGERKEDAQFHRIVAWNKLAELCSQLLSKGRRVYVDGRIQYREYTDAENNKRQISEIVIDDMIILDNKGVGAHTESVDLSGGGDLPQAEPEVTVDQPGDVGIEDIVIPDDIGKVDEETVKTDDGELKPTEEKTEEKVEEKKTDEMPF
jgi:single-strand DNA-binding protein